ncbi:MAG TPA: fructose-6-phosphate aldolase [Candidatus Paceibacterota bacterium]|nr:fructose-6-phosphate aldolase [Candidatus Paceibacterota bacterium]
MRFFIDTAVVDEIRKAAEWGVIDGVTTNPSLIAKAGKPFKDTILEICGIVDGPVSAEVTALDYEGMMNQAHEYAGWHKNIVIKLPITPNGVRACKSLSNEGIRTNLTLCFSTTQALLVAKAGATYVSPFVGRLDDVSERGMSLIEDIVQVFENYAFETQVLVASVRSPMHVADAALMGADVATIPFHVLEQLYKHPLTDKGIEQFMKDWEGVQK